MQIIHAINCKSLRSLTKVNIFNNKTFNISFLALLFIILIISLTPIGQTIFNLASLSALQWVIIACASIFIIPIVELCKYIINHWNRPKKNNKK